MNDRSGLSVDLTRLHSTLDALHEGFQVISFEYRYLFLNNAVVDQARRPAEELLGHTMMECFPGIEQTPMFAAVTRCLKERLGSDFENEFTYPDGRRAWFELRIRPCPEGLVILSLDISERKRLDNHLRQAGKMDALGQLAGSVAHDFNNLLAAIISYSSMVRAELSDRPELAADLEEVVKAGEHAAKLTRQLLDFSRLRPAKLEDLEVSPTVEAMLPMLNRLLGANIAVTPNLTAQGLVRADPHGLGQVLMNLAVNARDAMNKGGTLYIETSDAKLADDQVGRGGKIVPAGDYVLITVGDTGCGISDEVLERIFEPFFTTKAEGRGTGLGLSTSYAIVRQAGGFIWVDSTLEVGTTFKIYLPRLAT